MSSDTETTVELSGKIATQLSMSGSRHNSLFHYDVFGNVGNCVRVDVSCHGLPPTVKGFVGLKHAAKHYLRITVDEQTHKTLAIEHRGNPTWAEPISL
jgi:hypothetical protein